MEDFVSAPWLRRLLTVVLLGGLVLLGFRVLSPFIVPLVWAAILVAVIALVEWHFEDNVSFGFLYLFPMLMVGGCLTRWQIAGVAALCTGLTEAFDPFPWAIPVGISRIILTFAAFFGAGYYGFGAARSRRLANQLVPAQVGELGRGWIAFGVRRLDRDLGRVVAAEEGGIDHDTVHDALAAEADDRPVVARPAPAADNAHGIQRHAPQRAGCQGGIQGNGKAVGAGDFGGAAETRRLERGERKPAPRV